MSSFLLTLLSFVILVPMSFGQMDERNRGIQLYQDGKYDEAIGVLRKIVETEPVNKVAWTYLGGALYHTGKKDEALEAFRKPAGGPRYEARLDKSIKIISQSRAGYTERARRNGVKGTVLIVAEFRSDGTIGFAVPIRELPDGLTENAVESAKTIKFNPAIKAGAPVSMIRVLSYSFETY